MVVLVRERTFTPFYWPDSIYFLTKAGREYKRTLATLHDFSEQIIIVNLN